MVKIYLLAFLISKFISIEQEVNLVEIKIKGNFTSVEVSDFPYEGVLTIDLRGTFLGDVSSEDYLNSFVKRVEVKKSNGFTRIILRMAGPFEVIGKSTSGGLISVTLKPLQVRIPVEVLKRRETYSQPVEQVKVVKETVFVSKPAPVFIKAKDLTGYEISEFVRVVMGKNVVLQSTKRFTGQFSSPSLEGFLKEFPSYFERNAK